MIKIKTIAFTCFVSVFAGAMGGYAWAFYHYQIINNCQVLP